LFWTSSSQRVNDVLLTNAVDVNQEF
jgi:hypothetical protein